MLKRLKVLSIAAAAVMLMAGTASAATVIDFTTGSAGVGGQVYLDGANIIGTNIPIGIVSIVGAPANDGVYNVYGSVNGPPPLSPGFWGDLDFNTGTGAITIAGCIPGLVGSLTAGGQCSSIETLLSGTITQFANLFGTNNFVAVAGFDSKNRTLLTNLGLDPNTPFLLTGSVQTGNPFGQGPGNSQPSVSTDIANTAVPEPATMVLLGTGLLAAFRARRRQQV